MIRVFKSTSNSQDLVELDTGAIMENHFKGRKTSIIIDTNIMLYIEDAYHSGERHKKLKDWGVLHLAKMVRKNGKYGVFLSPGAAFLPVQTSVACCDLRLCRQCQGDSVLDAQPPVGKALRRCPCPRTRRW